MTYHFIQDQYLIDFDLPEGLLKIIEILEKLDKQADSEYLNYVATFDVACQYYVAKGKLTNNQLSFLKKRYHF